MKTKYNRSEIMKNAWQLFKSQEVRTMENWSICLKNAWQIAKNKPEPLNFDWVYKKNYKKVYNFAYNKLHNKDICDIIVNDVFIKVSTKLIMFNPEICKINTWICAIAKNRIIDYYRQLQIENRNLCHYSDCTDENGNEFFQIKDNTPDNSDSSELGKMIEKSFNLLPDNYKQIATLALKDNIKYEQICEIMNISMGQVKTMVCRARKMLQETLQPYLTE